MTFAPGQLRACYNQSIDDDQECTKSFIVRIVDNPNITPGDPQATQINIIDDDGSKHFSICDWICGFQAYPIFKIIV